MQSTNRELGVFLPSNYPRLVPQQRGELIHALTYVIDKELDNPYLQMLREAYRAKWNELLLPLIDRIEDGENIPPFLSMMRVAVADAMREKIRSGKDNLTNLPNGPSVHIATNRLIGLARRENRSVFALYIDLDHFKERVNDVLGHEAGDGVIIAIANLFTTTLRQYELVGRFSGDEFGICLFNGYDPTAIEAYIQRVAMSLGQIQNVPGLDDIGMSIGASMYNGNDGTLTSNELFHRAEIAMSHSKGLSGSRIKMTFWEPGMVMLPRNTSR